ncbi:MAG: response regulator [bacterium]|nr:response regulator [bacterium]
MIEKSTEVKTILVVEDDVALNKAIVLKLNKRGYTIATTFNAEDAFKVLEENNSVVLIWLDILLPGMNGLNFLELMRKNPLYKDKKVIVVSVSGGDDSKKRALELGAVDYLVKSAYDLDTLVSKVVSYI